jgi:hypothetical protein
MNATNSLDRLNDSSEERRLPGLIDALRVGELLSSGLAAPFDEPRSQKCNLMNFDISGPVRSRDANE